jgi:hypothetical protein|tara:strand:+ start:1264 stop:2088 length:825 start_codon:yes stop_codon:yes gene_type:complete
VARVRYVLVYPYSGFRDRLWDAEQHPDGRGRDPDVDAVARTSRRVCEAYSRGLVELGLEGNHGEVRVFVHRSHRDDEVVPVSTYLKWTEGFEMAHVGVPVGAGAWSEQRRARMLLEAFHAVMTRFGHARGWPLAGLERLHDDYLDTGLDLAWRSAWKSSPDRRTEACLDAWLHDDGFSRVRILLRDRTSGEIAGSSEVVEGPVAEVALKRESKTLRWRDRDTVELSLSTFLGNRTPVPLVASVPSLHQVTPWPERAPVRTEPAPEFSVDPAWSE